MALRWEWTEKCGTATIETSGKYFPDGLPRTKEVSLYQGNALLIMLNEFEEDGKQMWSMNSFFCDKEHAKRCLGLDKQYGEGNMYNDLNRLTKIRFNKAKIKKTDLKTLVTLFTQADFEDLTIELYTEKEEK